MRDGGDAIIRYDAAEEGWDMKKLLSAMITLFAVSLFVVQVASASIASDLKAKVDSGMSAEAAVAAVIASGADPADVVAAALDAGYDPQAVINGAVNSGTPADDVVAVAEAAVESGKVSADDIGSMLTTAGAAPSAVSQAVSAVTGDTSGGGSYSGSGVIYIPGGGNTGGGGSSSPN